MNSKKIIIKEIVVGFSTNSDGVVLKNAIEKLIKTTNIVVLSFEGITSISSSFLNSSLGEIIEKYGFDFLKTKLKLQITLQVSP